MACPSSGGWPAQVPSAQPLCVALGTSRGFGAEAEMVSSCALCGSSLLPALRWLHPRRFPVAVSGFPGRPVLCCALSPPVPSAGGPGSVPEMPCTAQSPKLKELLAEGSIVKARIEFGFFPPKCGSLCQVSVELLWLSQVMPEVPGSWMSPGHAWAALGSGRAEALQTNPLLPAAPLLCWAWSW